MSGINSCCLNTFGWLVIRRQQQFLEKLILGNDGNQKVIQLEDQVKLLKSTVQYLTGNFNKIHANCIVRFKQFMKDNARLQKKVEKPVAEDSIFEPASKLIEVSQDPPLIVELVQDTVDAV